MGMWGVLVLVLIAIACGEWARRKRKSTIQCLLDSRTSVAVEAIASRYYPEHPKVRVMEIWSELSRALHADPTKMRPEDEFLGVYGRVPGYPMADDLSDVEEAFARRCASEGKKLPNDRVRSVDDYMKWLLTEQEPS